MTGFIAGLYVFQFAEKSRWLKTFAGLAAAAVVALLLAGIQLAPTLSLLQESDRAGGLSDAMVYSWSLNPLRLIELAAAYPFGEFVSGTSYWGGGLVRHETGVPFVYSPYVGPFVIALAVLGLRKGKGLVLWGVLFLLGCALALGDHTPLYGLLKDYLPLWESFRYPQKMLAISTFALAILAGWGADRLAKPGDDDNLSVARRVLVVLFALSTLIWLSFTVFTSSLIDWATQLASRDHFTDLTGTAAAEVLLTSLRGTALRLLVVVGLIVLWSRNWHRSRLTVAFCVLVVADLALVNGPLVRTTDQALFTGPHAAAEAIAQAYEGEVPARIYRDTSVTIPDFELDGPHEYEARRWWDQLTLLPNVGVEYGLSYVRAMGVTPSPEAEAFWSALAGDGGRAIQLTGVNFIIAAPGSYAFSNQDLFRQVYAHAEAEVAVYEYTAALPTIRLVYNAERPDPDNALERLLAADFDVRSSLVVGEQGEELTSQRGWDSVTVTDYDLGELRVELDAAEEAYLVVADTYNSDWEATLDGEPIPILRANLTMRAVRIPPGQHVVVMKMKSGSLRAGVALSIVGLVLVLGMFGFALSRRPQAFSSR